MASTTTIRTPRRLAEHADGRDIASTAAGHETVDQRRCECEERSRSNTATVDGVEYCPDCGVVLSDCQLERSEPGWRDPEDRRLGPSQGQQWVNTGTTIGWDASTGGRFRRYNDRLTNQERSLVSGLREVRSVSAGVELPDSTRERAAYWYRKTAQERLLKGRSIEAFAAACVFIAARERQYPVTVDGLAEFSPVTSSKTRHHVRVLQSELDAPVAPAHPRDFLPLIVSRLGVGPAIERRAARYLEEVTADELHVGKHPAAVAATAIYAATTEAGTELTQEDIADAANVSTVTISRQYQAIREIGSDT